MKNDLILAFFKEKLTLALIKDKILTSCYNFNYSFTKYWSLEEIYHFFVCD